MKTMIAASGLSLLLGMSAALAQTTAPTTTPPSGSMQMSQAQCDSMWSKMNASGGASVSEAQAKSYTTSFSQVDTNKDGQLSQTEFNMGCQKGMFMDSATTGSGTGTTGTTGSGTMKK